MRRNYFLGLLTGCFLLASMLTGCGGGDGGASTSKSSDPGSSSNSAPTVSGTPGSTAVVGQAYSFQPLAADANGDQLSFTVANLPSWATFNAQTGRVTGTPAATEVGAYANITITVSDGSSNAALAPFSITVSEVGTGTAMLSWTPPTQNSDGTSLSNLAGYQVKYGRDEANLDQTVNLDNPSINNYVVENLGSGTWYFAVVAVNSSGATSQLSNTGSKTVS